MQRAKATAAAAKKKAATEAQATAKAEAAAAEAARKEQDAAAKAGAKKSAEDATAAAYDGPERIAGSVEDLVAEMNSSVPARGHYHHSVTHSDSVALDGTAPAPAAEERAEEGGSDDILHEGELMHKTAVMRRSKKKALQLRRSGDFYSFSKRTDQWVLFEPRGLEALTYDPTVVLDGEPGFQIRETTFIFTKASTGDEREAWFNALRVAGYVVGAASSAAAETSDTGAARVGHEYHKYLSRCKRAQMDHLFNEPQHDRLEVAFAAMDTSTDGLIDMRELQRFGVVAAQAHSIMHDYDLDDISGAMDAAGMGMLSKTEFIMMVHDKAATDVASGTPGHTVEARVATWEHAISAAAAALEPAVAALNQDEVMARLIDLKLRVRSGARDGGRGARETAEVHHEMHQLLQRLL